jgi:hypothetical protein
VRENKAPVCHAEGQLIFPSNLKDRHKSDQDPCDAHAPQDEGTTEEHNLERVARDTQVGELIAFTVSEEDGEVLTRDKKRVTALAQRTQREERREDEGRLGRTIDDET